MPVRRFLVTFAAVATFSASLGACALLVGDPDGHRLDPIPADSPDAAPTEEGGGPDVFVAETASNETGAADVRDVQVEAAPKDAAFGGMPVTLASGTMTPGGIVTTADALYWSNIDDSTIRRLPRGDGGLPGPSGSTTVINVLNAGAQAASDLLVDGTLLYALVGPSAGASTSCRTYLDFTLPTASGVSCAKPNNVCGSSSIGSRVAIDNTSIYLSNGTCRYVLYTAKPGNDPNGWKTFGSLSSPVVALGSDNTNLYYAFDREIDMQPLAGSAAPVTFALSHTPIVDLVVDDTSVYWVNNEGEVETLVKAQIGEPPTILASGQANPSRLAFDSKNLYWTNSGNAVQSMGSVMMVPKDGGTPVTLAPNQTLPNLAPIAVDGVALYWGSSTGLMELAR
jgi:hypothetical protein